MLIRTATPDDLPALTYLDPLLVKAPGRLAEVAHALIDQQVFVALVGGEVAGYLILTHTFFGNGFVALLVVDPAHRRAGIGSALMRQARALCRTPKLFTSTNASNAPMQALLDRLGFRHCGTIDALDVGDPEWVYVDIGG
ncbi:MAG: GNAT family N-acetyltransferase [Anaerolineales bacterium]|nr:GNAT family N-acetyltransferase [Anaerolineales bacterium]